MKLLTVFSVLLSSLSFASAQADAQNNNYLGVSPVERHVVNSTQAQQILEAAVQEAFSIGVPSNIAVVDPAAYLVAFFRMDSAFLGR